MLSSQKSNSSLLLSEGILAKISKYEHELTSVDLSTWKANNGESLISIKMWGRRGRVGKAHGC